MSFVAGSYLARFKTAVDKCRQSWSVSFSVKL